MIDWRENKPCPRTLSDELKEKRALGLGTENFQWVNELIEGLKINDEKEADEYEEQPEEPKEAMDALVKIGKSAVESLLGFLKNRSKYSCLYAIKVLGEIRDPRAIEPIIEAFSSEEYGYAFESYDDYEQAKLALRKIGLPALDPTLNYLKEKKEEDDEVALCDALEILSGIKDEKSFAALVDMTSYPNEEVQANAFRLLGEYGDKRAVEHLSGFLEDEDFRDEAKEAIRNLLYQVDPKRYRNILAKHGIIGEARVASLEEKIRPLVRGMKHAYEFEKKFEGDDAQKLNDIAREYRISESIEKLLREIIELTVDEALLSNKAYEQMKIIDEELRGARWDLEEEHEEELSIINREIPDLVKEEKRSYKGLTRTRWGPHPKLDELCKRIWEWLKRQGFLVIKRNRTLWGRRGKKDSRKGCLIHLGKDEDKPRTWGLVYLIVWGNAWIEGEAETFTESFWDFVETSGLVKTELRLKDLHTRKDAIIFTKIHGLKPCYNKSGLYFRPHVGKKKRKLLADLLKVDSKEAAEHLREKYEL